MNAAAHSAWQALQALPKPSLAELFAVPDRVGQWSARLELPGGAIRFDWSKTHLDVAHAAGFVALTRAVQFKAKRGAMFAGEVINLSEGRAVEHTALRGMGREPSVEEAGALHLRMKSLVEAIHAGVLGEVRHLIHIGIGGSALGPALAIDALTRDGARVAVHVVSNIDGCALEMAFRACDPATTLVAVASKTFTTIETMTNAESALVWLRENGVADACGRVIALTADPDKAVEWGVDETRVLPFPASVGGRYSLWSSIGFPIALALGWDAFAAFLAGAAAIDRHFLEAEDAANLPLRAAWADLYYTRLRHCQTRACFAYDERLRLLPSYLQQLEMESNGKSVKADGSPVEGPTAPITWGGVGTDAQHAVFQLLHQGTSLIPVDFIAIIAPGDDLAPDHHHHLLANCLAQGAALMVGRASPDGARNYPGGRPSATILCEELNPATLGALIAFHEHRTFAGGILMEINSFDQFGVELGKDLARSIVAGEASFDPSTEALLREAGIK